ncbi:MAG: hypothetical protein COC05_01235 [Gammaproteobacteria bacterium]|nr:MAG: hypothetical protein COC05_01235 [Gammaproteobacteria bacterium]
MEKIDCTILISIKPEYVDMIFCGGKTVELRRVLPKNLTDDAELIIYASSPTRSIVGKARIKRVEDHPVEKLWRKLGHKTGISAKYFKEYFKGKDRGYGLVLDEIVKFSKPYPLNHLREKLNFSPPQSFMYATADLMEHIR